MLPLRRDARRGWMFTFVWSGSCCVRIVGLALPTDLLYTATTLSHLHISCLFLCNGLSSLQSAWITPANVEAKAMQFAAFINQKGAGYATNSLLVPLGSDFQYQNATINYYNMDLLMAHVNANTSRHVLPLVQFSFNLFFSFFSSFYIYFFGHFTFVLSNVCSPYAFYILFNLCLPPFVFRSLCDQ
jgi:hypothetical protein